MIQTKTVNGVNCYVHESDSRVDDIYAAYGSKMTIKQLSVATGADVAGNLPYADYKVAGVPLGRNVVGGKEVSVDGPKTVARDSLYMLPDGTMHIGRPPAGVLWALQGSPPLLEDGVDVVDDGIKRDQLGTDIWKNDAKHLRIAYGLKSPYELVIVRTRANVTLKALAAIMKAQGCVNAINGDGGGSSTLYPADSGNGRKLGAALCIKEGEKLEHIGDAKPVLIIDPGHGGNDPGASGNGIIEKNDVLSISLYQFHRFREIGVPVALTRDREVTLESTQRATIVKNSGAKHCISNHINAATTTTAAGAEIIHSIYNDGKLAKVFAQALAAAGQTLRPTATYSRKNDGGGDYYFMHRLTGSVTTNIIEYGFCTNAADAARLTANWKTYAEAVVKAYCEFIGHKYVAPEAPKPAEPVSDQVDIVVNGVKLSQKGTLKDGVTSIPVRAVAEALGAAVRWDGVSRTVYLDKGVK